MAGFARLQGQLRGLAAAAQLGGFGATAGIFVARLQAQHHGDALAVQALRAQRVGALQFLVCLGMAALRCQRLGNGIEQLRTPAQGQVRVVRRPGRDDLGPQTVCLQHRQCLQQHRMTRGDTANVALFLHQWQRLACHCQCRIRIAGFAQRFAGAGQCCGHAGLIAELTAERQRALEVQQGGLGLLRGQRRAVLVFDQAALEACRLAVQARQGMLQIIFGFAVFCHAPADKAGQRPQLGQRVQLQAQGVLAHRTLVAGLRRLPCLIAAAGGQHAPHVDRFHFAQQIVATQCPRPLTQVFQTRHHAAVGILAHIAQCLHGIQPQLRLRGVAMQLLQHGARLAEHQLAMIVVFQRDQDARLCQQGPELRVGVAIAARLLQKGLGGLQRGLGVVDCGRFDRLPRLRLRPHHRAAQQ
ncbi:hypothetical protein XGA_4045 [Xanthomonas hortorum ATCC 19865]|nr:hypothetical protein XGA_4045 [Xanthomonas hortorum ATCC 19865]